VTTHSAPAPGATAIAPPVLPAGLDTPALIIDIGIVEANARRLGDQLRDRGVALRPHTKTHKSVALARIQLAAGASGITTGTLGEAEVMAGGGIERHLHRLPRLGRRAEGGTTGRAARSKGPRPVCWVRFRRRRRATRGGRGLEWAAPSCRARDRSRQRTDRRRTGPSRPDRRRGARPRPGGHRGLHPRWPRSIAAQTPWGVPPATRVWPRSSLIGTDITSEDSGTRG